MLLEVIDSCTTLRLQDAYKAELASAYGIQFTSLLALNNMPIKRYADFLLRQGELQSYMEVRLRLQAGWGCLCVQGLHLPALYCSR